MAEPKLSEESERLLAMMRGAGLGMETSLVTRAVHLESALGALRARMVYLESTLAGLSVANARLELENDKLIEALSERNK